MHRSTFTNVALSAEHDKYVITTVYRLTDKLNVRKRRLALEGPNASAYKDVVISSMALPRARRTGTGPGTGPGTISGYSNFLERYRRNIKESSEAAHSQRYAYTSTGCPKNAFHHEMDCHCPAGMEYSTGSYQCEVENAIVLSDWVEKSDDGENNADDGENKADGDQGENSADSDSGAGRVLVVDNTTTATIIFAITCTPYLVMLLWF